MGKGNMPAVLQVKILKNLNLLPQMTVKLTDYLSFLIFQILCCESEVDKGHPTKINLKKKTDLYRQII